MAPYIKESGASHGDRSWPYHMRSTRERNAGLGLIAELRALEAGIGAFT
jgi:hypothetical protein